MKLIVGLGNPGIEYKNNRHNLGFMALDSLSAHYQFEDWKSKLEGKFAAKLFGSEKIILVKPQTYMNLSGFCVAKFKQFFKISEDNIFVIYDDIDLELGHIKFKRGGGDAGHACTWHWTTGASTPSNCPHLQCDLRAIVDPVACCKTCQREIQITAIV